MFSFLKSSKIQLPVFLLCISCGVSTPVSSTQGVAETSSLWQKKLINVCWENTGSKKFYWIKEKEKESIQKAIERSYNRETPIQFIGWKECSQTQNPDLILTNFLKPSAGVLAKAGDIGRSRREQERKIEFNFSYGCDYIFYSTTGKKGDRELCISYGSIHEFGHILGLRHEHANPSSTCDKRWINKEPLQRRRGPYEITNYDPTSIMNYCHMQDMFEQAIPAEEANLSAGDKEILKKLYGDL